MHDARFVVLADLLADYRLPGCSTKGGMDRLSGAEQAALLAFLGALDDRAFLTDRRVASPYRSAASRAGDPAPPPLP